MLKELRDFDWKAHLTRLLGHGPSDDILRPHAHHVLFQKGLGLAQQKLVAEGMEILIKHGIDPLYGLENLVWARNGGGQHSLEALEEVLRQLRKADNNDRGTTEDILKALERLKKIARKK